MSKIIVSDTTTLIVLENLSALPLLCQLFGQVLIPQTVFDELQSGCSLHAATVTEIRLFQNS